MKEKCALCPMLTHNENPDYDVPLCDPCLNKYPSQEKLDEALQEKGIEIPEIPEFVFKCNDGGEFKICSKEEAISYINSLMECFEIKKEELGW